MRLTNFFKTLKASFDQIKSLDELYVHKFPKPLNRNKSEKEEEEITMLLIPTLNTYHLAKLSCVRIYNQYGGSCEVYATLAIVLGCEYYYTGDTIRINQANNLMKLALEAAYEYGTKYNQIRKYNEILIALRTRTISPRETFAYWLQLK